MSGMNNMFRMINAHRMGTIFTIGNTQSTVCVNYVYRAPWIYDRAVTSFVT